MTLSDELRTFLMSKGASLVGFADLKEIPPDVRDNYPSGISFGVALNPKIIAGISEGPTKAYLKEYQRADFLLVELGTVTVQFLKQRGYKAKPHTTPGIENPDILMNKLPQKTVATRAGLGWIGKCALLITLEFGSAVRLGSVLTNAGFDTGVAVNQSQCNDCTACVDICPAGAITGEEWYVGITRDALVDAFACRQTARELLLKRTGGEIIGRTLCGMCIAVCPWTQKYLEKAAIHQ